MLFICLRHHILRIYFEICKWRQSLCSPLERKLYSNDFGGCTQRKNKKKKKGRESTARIAFYYKMLSSLLFLIHNKFKPPSRLWSCLFVGFSKFFFFQGFRAVLFDGDMHGVIATTPVFSNTTLPPPPRLGGAQRGSQTCNKQEGPRLDSGKMGTFRGI